MKPITENHIEAVAIKQQHSLSWQYLYILGIELGAMYDGTVIRIGGSKDYGPNFLRLASKINGKLYNVDYGHMSKVVVGVGKGVQAGDLVGYMGRLGNLAGTSFPTHVHIAVWRPFNGLQGFVKPSWK